MFPEQPGAGAVPGAGGRGFFPGGGCSAELSGCLVVGLRAEPLSWSLSLCWWQNGCRGRVPAPRLCWPV